MKVDVDQLIDDAESTALEDAFAGKSSSVK